MKEKSNILKQIFEEVKLEEDKKLNAYPKDVAVKIQSGYLLGYADCWNNLMVRLIKAGFINVEDVCEELKK